MNAVAQFIVELSWALTMGILVAGGMLAAQAAGVALALVAAVGLGWALCKRVTRRRP